MLPWLTIRENVMIPLKIVEPFRRDWARKKKGEYAERADALLAQVGLHTVPVDGQARHWTQRAADWGLTAYDACYLELALRRRLPLATLDADLLAAMQRCGVARAELGT